MSSRTPSRVPAQHAPPYRLPAFPETPVTSHMPSTATRASTHSLVSMPSVPSFATPATPRERTIRRPASMMSLTTSSRRGSRLNMRSPVANVGPGFPATPSSQGSYRGKIHVGVRCKPEPEPNVNDKWSVSSRANSICHNTAGEFVFDAVFDGASTNEDVFDRSVRPLVGQVIDGYNATVFAYGITGSGKTWTMQGEYDADPGVIPRSVALLFDMLPTGSSVKVSYLEIYNERVFDLLHSPRTSLSSDSPVMPSGGSNKEGSLGSEITLRDDVRGVRAVGLTEVVAESALELLECIATGDQFRRTSSTQYNERSSRSHAVVQITVTTSENTAQLCLCDLAGSERAVEEAARRREGSYINKSLLALSTVISKLSQGGVGHIPYRDSKLTRLLHPALSGHAIVAVVCTIQTGSASAAETLNTLRFAAKAKNVVVTARRGSMFEDSSANPAVLEQLRQEIQTLRIELAAVNAHREDMEEQMEIYMRAKDDDTMDSLEQMAGISPGCENIMDDAQIETLENANQLLREENAELRNKISELTGHMAELSNAVEELAQETPLRTPSASSSPPRVSSSEISELREQLEDKNAEIALLRKIKTYRDGASISVS